MAPIPHTSTHVRVASCGLPSTTQMPYLRVWRVELPLNNVDLHEVGAVVVAKVRD
jgi:hypothetical protein